MYGIFLGLGNQTRTKLTTHSGRMSLRWLATLVNRGSNWRTFSFLSLYLSSRKTPLWKSIVQKNLYFSFRNEVFLLSGNAGSEGHHICLFLPSVMQGLQKQCSHSSQFWLCGIQNVLSKSSALMSSFPVVFSSHIISSNSHSLKLMNWIIDSLWSEFTLKVIILVSSFSSILLQEWWPELEGKF